MREILFRGKRIDNGEWIEGDLIHAPDGRVAISTDDDLMDVNPETVCQYTGLKDKNGKKIFEGDIVKVRFEEARIGAKEGFYNYHVKYDERRAEFEFFGNENLYGRPIFEECSQPIMEVIGNIFDNPELCE